MPARVLAGAPDAGRGRPGAARLRRLHDRALADRADRHAGCGCARPIPERAAAFWRRHRRPRRPALHRGQGQGVDPALVRGQPRRLPAGAGESAGRAGGGVDERADHALASSGPRRVRARCSARCSRREPAAPGRSRPGRRRDEPPLLFVPGYGHGAWAFAEHWLEHTAERGFPAYAMSLRGHGDSGPAGKPTLRAYAHDVVQVAAGLPRQAVLIGHGVGALVVARRAGPLPGPGRCAGRAGVRRLAARSAPRCAATRRAPCRRSSAAGCGCAAASCSAASCTRRRGQGLPGAGSARRRPAAQWQLLRRHTPEPPVGDPPVLVVGSPDDRIVPAPSLERVARRYGGAPLLFPGMGHDLMLDAALAGADRRDPRLAEQGGALTHPLAPLSAGSTRRPQLR